MVNDIGSPLSGKGELRPVFDRRQFLKSTFSAAAFCASIACTPRGTRDEVPVDSSAGLDDSRRFLDQATMGARPGEAAALQGSFTDWLDAQFALPYTLVDSSMLNNTPGNRNNITRMAMFARWCNEPAQLRLRVTHVLSQIVCCGPSGWSNELDSGLWYNALMFRAFGNYEDVLRLTITHRHMGVYLNNLNNNAADGRSPSQNFSRELLQLFSMGVFALNRDGSVVRDQSGNPVKAYTLQDVNSLARLLCGWSLPFANATPGQDGTFADGTMNLAPMLAYNGPPVTLFGTTFPAVAAPDENTVMTRMNACLSLIMAQPTTAAYIAKQFIKKMVTDTPSPQYVARVSSAFRDNGAGVRGDIKAIVTAVLLDPEARGNAKPLTFGRAQEWVLSVVKAMRYGQMQPIPEPRGSDYLGFRWATDRGPYDPMQNILGRMGQVPTVPASVFNDYPFEYQINGVEAPASAMWRAPAILANVAHVLPLSAGLTDPAPSTQFDGTGRWDLTWLIDMFERVVASTPGTDPQKQTAAITALVDQVNADLNQGRPMTSGARQQTISFIAVDSAALPTREKLGWLINFIRCLPDSSIVV
jgi:uncharacterized protein (DUF1800 family)